jgi:hypothetical protein
MNVTFNNQTAMGVDSLDTLELIPLITINSVAIIGNSIVIIILMQRMFRKKPIFRYLIVATIFDTFNVILLWPNSYRHKFLINHIEIICKLFKFIDNMIGPFTAWVNVIASFDTLMLVKNPTKFKFRKNYKYQIFVILVGFFVTCLISLPAVFINSIGGEDNYCEPRYTPLNFHLFYFELYLFTVPVLIPFLINIVVSSITFLYLRKTQININQNNYKKSKSLFKTTVYLNLVFLITYFTSFIIKIIFIFYIKIEIPFILGHFLDLLIYFYYSSDFFIYMIANRLFRETFISFFKCEQTRNSSFLS